MFYNVKFDLKVIDGHIRSHFEYWEKVSWFLNKNITIKSFDLIITFVLFYLVQKSIERINYLTLKTSYLRLSEIKYFRNCWILAFSSTFVYEPILMQIRMNANIIKRHIFISLSMVFFYIRSLSFLKINFLSDIFLSKIWYYQNFVCIITL